MRSEDEWYGRFRLRLEASRHFGAEEIDAAVAEAKMLGGDVGPAAVLGPAREYADELIRSRVPAEARARSDLHAFSAGDLAVVSGMLLGCALILHTAVLLFSANWTLSISVNGVVGSAVTVAAAATLGASYVLRRMGLPRVGIGCLCSVPVLIVLAAGAFLRLPDDVMGQVWSIVLGLAGAVVGGVSLALFMRTAGEPPPLSDGPKDPQRWFRRLRGLLIGRHDVPPRVAEALVARSRGRFAESTSALPCDRFGPLAAHAMEIAEGAQRRTPLLHRHEVTTSAMAALWLVMFLVDVSGGGDGWSTWFRLVVAVLLTAIAVVAWMRLRRTQPAGSA